MSERYINPEVRGSFRRSGSSFISRSAGGFVSCPPYVIASAASRRLSEEAQLDLPEGYDESTLDTIKAITGWVDQDVPVSFRQAAELAMIGFQLQDLDSEGKVEPPLRDFENQAISHLLGEVCLLNFDGMSSPELSDADITYIKTIQYSLAGPQNS